MKLTNRRLVDTVILTVLVGLVLLPLVPVYGARAGLIPVLGGLLLGVSVALLAAVRKWSLWIAAALMFGAYLLFGPVLEAPTLALSGVLPWCGRWFPFGKRRSPCRRPLGALALWRRCRS